MNKATTGMLSLLLCGVTMYPTPAGSESIVNSIDDTTKQRCWDRRFPAQAPSLELVSYPLWSQAEMDEVRTANLGSIYVDLDADGDLDILGADGKMYQNMFGTLKHQLVSKL